MTKPFIHNFCWKPQNGTIFTVVSRRDGSIIGRYRGRPFFMFHHVNAFEQQDKIFLDIIVHEDASSIFSHTIDDLMLDKRDTKSKHRNLSRFTIDLTNISVSDQILSEVENPEMPRINDCYNTQPYSYVYSLSDSYLGLFKKLVKINIDTKEICYWQEEYCYPGEPVFIISPDGVDEDDGIIVSVVLDTKQKSSFLLILDAKTFGELARVLVPQHIPFGLHGNFYESVLLKNNVN